MDPYSNPHKWQHLGSPLPKYGIAAFYDDGLKQSPPTNIIELADNLLKAVLETQWNIIFPTQQGCASCGIAVILAVFDFVDNPADNAIPHFHWSFHVMGSHRQRLLCRFTQWK